MDAAVRVSPNPMAVAAVVLRDGRFIYLANYTEVLQNINKDFLDGTEQRLLMEPLLLPT
jgi:hypothetical protein